MVFENVCSERLLMRLVADRLSVRWFLGYNLDEPLPDHSSLTRIRVRYGLEIFRRFFELIVEQCQQAGLVWGRELYFDATHVLANAALDSLVLRFAVEARAAIRAHLDALFSDETPPAEPQTAPHPHPADAVGRHNPTPALPTPLPVVLVNSSASCSSRPNETKTMKPSVCRAHATRSTTRQQSAVALLYHSQSRQ
ncbi:MAG: transposase [Ktedonobacterales bacterium]